MTALDDDAVRRTVVAAATHVFSKDELRESGLATALNAARVGEAGDEDVLAAETAERRYDELAFTIREAAESRGDTTGGEAYIDAFRQARAASAIKELLIGNYGRARYEANHALGTEG